MPVLSYTSTTLEAGVQIGPFSPQLRDKNAHFAQEFNLNLVNQTRPILTALLSVLVSATGAALWCSKTVQGQFTLRP